MKSARVIMDSFQSLPDNSREHLLQLADKVREVVPVDTRSLRVYTDQLCLNTKQRLSLEPLSKWIKKNHPYLYYLRAVNNPELTEVELAYTRAKTEKKNSRAYSRFIRRSEVFYVGSSWDLLKRLEDHLGYSAKDTYALQLLHWARGMNLDIEVVCAEYPEGIEKETLQTLEDTLWDTLKPMFGRKGQR